MPESIERSSWNHRYGRRTCWFRRRCWPETGKPTVVLWKIGSWKSGKRIIVWRSFLVIHRDIWSLTAHPNAVLVIALNGFGSLVHSSNPRRDALLFGRSRRCEIHGITSCLMKAKNEPRLTVHRSVSSDGCKGRLETKVSTVRILSEDTLSRSAVGPANVLRLPAIWHKMGLAAPIGSAVRRRIPCSSMRRGELRPKMTNITGVALQSQEVV